MASLYDANARVRLAGPDVALDVVLLQPRIEHIGTEAGAVVAAKLPHRAEMLDPAPLDSLGDLAAALVVDQAAHDITHGRIHHRQDALLAIGRLDVENVRVDHVVEVAWPA